MQSFQPNYGNNTLVLTRNQTMSTRSPIITGGSYNVSISPNLPLGLFFDPSNGSFEAHLQSIKQRKLPIAVSNISGSDIINISIAIGEIAQITTFDTSNVTLVRGFNITRFKTIKPEVMSSLSKQILHCRKVCIFFVNKQRFDRGTPTTLSPWTDYTVWSNNSFGSDSNIISMRVVPAYDYGNNTLVLTRNQTMSTVLQLSLEGHSVQSPFRQHCQQDCSLSRPAIWTHHHESSSSSYMVTVSNPCGTDTSIISIAISEILRFLNTTCLMCLIVGFPPISPDIDRWCCCNFRSASPAAPGLILNPATGILSGIPSVDTVSTVHTIWANAQFWSSSWPIVLRSCPELICHQLHSINSERDDDTLFSYN